MIGEVKHMQIETGREADIEQWMRLVAMVRDAFPGLETAEALREHREAVLNFMGRDSAICAKAQGKIIGALLFSKEASEICFLAVDPDHRRQHAAERMVAFMMTQLDPRRDVSVTTYREGAPGGSAARAFYRRMGFTEGELTEEFGSPVQRFIFRR